MTTSSTDWYITVTNEPVSSYISFLENLEYLSTKSKSSLTNIVTGCVIPENQAKLLVKCEIVVENIYKDTLNERVFYL